MSHICKCEHGKFLALCKICYPHSEPTKEEIERWSCKPQYRELSDEEIWKAFDETIGGNSWFGDELNDFARAILKKASEK